MPDNHTAGIALRRSDSFSIDNDRFANEIWGEHFIMFPCNGSVRRFPHLYPAAMSAAQYLPTPPAQQTAGGDRHQAERRGLRHRRQTTTALAARRVEGRAGLREGDVGVDDEVIIAIDLAVVVEVAVVITGDLRKDVAVDGEVVV